MSDRLPTVHRPPLAVAPYAPASALDFPDPVAYGLAEVTRRDLTS